jgi:hypothetical protein
MSESTVDSAACRRQQRGPFATALAADELRSAGPTLRRVSLGQTSGRPPWDDADALWDWLLYVRQPTTSADVRRPAYAAAGLAFASAAVSLFWTVGGTWLLDTVGGAIEDLARDRSAPAIALGIVTIMLKATAGVLALALARPWGSHLGRRLLLSANTFASVGLIFWGGINVAIGSLVLAGVIEPAEDVDEHALRWHVFVWDLWFLLWGLALAIAIARFRRRAR